MRKNAFLLVAVLLLGFTGIAQAEDKKAVYDLTSGDAEKIESRLLGGIKRIAVYYKEQGDTFKAVIAISGDSYKYFVEDIASSPFKDDEALILVQKKLAPLLRELAEDYDVRFEMCGAGMKARKIAPESLYSFVNTDKIKPVYMIDWQNKGYAYMPFH